MSGKKNKLTFITTLCCILIASQLNATVQSKNYLKQSNQDSLKRKKQKMIPKGNQATEEPTRAVFNHISHKEAAAALSQNSGVPLSAHIIDLINQTDQTTLTAITNNRRLAKNISANQSNVASLTDYVSTYMTAHEFATNLSPKESPGDYADEYMNGIATILGIYNAISYINNILNLIANVLNVSDNNNAGGITESNSMAMRLLTIYQEDIRNFIENPTEAPITPSNEQTSSIPSNKPEIDSIIRNSTQFLQNESPSTTSITYSTGVGSNNNYTSNIAKILIKNIINDQSSGLITGIETALLVSLLNQFSDPNNSFLLDSTQDPENINANNTQTSQEIENSTTQGTIEYNLVNSSVDTDSTFSPAFLGYQQNTDTIQAFALAFANAGTFFNKSVPLQKKDYIKSYVAAYLDQIKKPATNFLEATTYAHNYASSFVEALNDSTFKNPYGYAAAYAEELPKISDRSLAKITTKIFSNLSTANSFPTTYKDIIQGINQTQIPSLTITQINSLASTLTQYQIGGIAITQLLQLPIATLKILLPKLNTSQIQALTPQILTQLSKSELLSLVRNLTTDQIQSLPLKQVQEIPTTPGTLLGDFLQTQVTFNAEVTSLLNQLGASERFSALPKQDPSDATLTGPWVVTWNQSTGTLGYTQKSIGSSSSSASYNGFYSSNRYKHDVIPLEKRNSEKTNNLVNKLLKLNPVYFTYNNDITNKEHIGLIAEELIKEFPEFVHLDEQGRPDSVNYAQISALLIYAFQGLHKETKVLQAAYEEQQKTLEILALRIKKLEDPK